MMKNISLNIRSIGANPRILIDLLDKKPEPDGKIRWQRGDQIAIGEGVSIRYDYRKIYEAEAAAEPIAFTIVFMSGIAGNLIASYIYDKLKQYKDRIEEIKINDKPVALSKEDIEKAFLQAIDELEKQEN